MTIKEKLQHYLWAWRTLDGIVRDYRRFSRNQDDHATDDFCEAMRCHMEDIVEYRRRHKITPRWLP